jgi:hypothetical protein
VEALCAGKVSYPLWQVVCEIGDPNRLTGVVRSLQNAKYGETIVNPLNRWRNRGATDPRDKGYVLIGLYQQMLLPSIQSCDYEISAADLYTKVIFDLIQLGQNLRPLISRRGEPPVTPALPTWALDLAEC